MIRTELVSVTTTGSNGSAAGSATSHILTGRLIAVYIDYTNQPSTTDVTIATVNAPVRTLLTITDANTDAWFYPRVQVHGVTGTALTMDGTRLLTDTLPLNDYVGVTVAQGDSAKTVDVYLIYES